MRDEPNTFIKSRSVLQAISKNHQEYVKFHFFDNLLKFVWNEMRLWYHHPETKHLIPLTKFLSTQNSAFIENGSLQESIRLEMIKVLKHEYPDCDIQYIESEKQIIIDWS